MKLLFICESFPTSSQADFTGGVEARDYYIAKYLAKENTVTVITNARTDTPKHQQIKNINVIRVGIPTTQENRQKPHIRITFSVLALIQALKTDFELIQASNAFTQIIAFVAGLIKSKPKVALIPDIYVGSWIKNTGLATGVVGEILERTSLSLPWNKIISWSKITQKKLENFGVPSSRIKVIYGGVDTKSCTKINVAKSKKPSIAFAARLVHYKKADTLIRAAQLLKQQLPSIHINLIGTGPELANLKRLSKKLGLSDQITFYGFVESHLTVLKIIKKSHLFCLPSIVEGFGLVTVEAMACGTPYINSKIPPTIEVTQNGQGGLLFQPQNHQDLAKQAIKLLTDSKLYSKKQKEAQKLSQTYDWSQISQQTEKTFKQIINS